MQPSDFLLAISIYLLIGILCMSWAAWTNSIKFCEAKIEDPTTPVTVAFHILYYQMLAWPAFLIVEFNQWRHYDALIESVNRHNAEVRRKQGG